MKGKRKKVLGQLKLYSGDTQLHLNNSGNDGDVIAFNVASVDKHYIKDGMAYIVLKRSSGYEIIEDESYIKDNKEVADLLDDLNTGFFGDGN
jgi:hypothetical protein